MTSREFFDSPQKGVITTRTAKARVFVFSTRGWSVIEAQLAKTFQSGAAVMLSEMGRSYGRGVAKEVSQATQDSKTAMAFIVGLASAAGWGEMSVGGEVKKASKLTITVKDCAFCAEGVTGRSPVCHFVGGVIAGAAQELFKRPYGMREEECMRMGDPICRFELKSS